MACELHGPQSERDVVDHLARPTGQIVCVECMYGPKKAETDPAPAPEPTREPVVEPAAPDVPKKSSRRA